MALRLQARLRVIPQQRIATLTVNPALDVSTAVPYVVPDHKLRCTELVRGPGGGGINVARAIRRLRGDAIACFPVDGPSSDLMLSLLEAEGVPRRVVRVRGPIRENPT
jgi:6-phosphofructokinase 2